MFLEPMLPSSALFPLPSVFPFAARYAKAIDQSLPLSPYFTATAHRNDLLLIVPDPHAYLSPWSILLIGNLITPIPNPNIVPSHQLNLQGVPLSHLSLKFSLPPLQRNFAVLDVDGHSAASTFCEHMFSIASFMPGKPRVAFAILCVYPYSTGHSLLDDPNTMAMSNPANMPGVPTVLSMAMQPPDVLNLVVTDVANLVI